MKKIEWVIFVVVVLCALFIYFYKDTETSNEVAKPIADATYVCDEERTIRAVYYEELDSDGSVEINIDGGETIRLMQTISASGARYSDGDPQTEQGQSGAESLVFWNKGNTALILRENEMDLNYSNCIAN